jgi:hypothetical protein
MLDLVVEADVVGDVDLDGAVAERLHHLVGLEALVLGLVGVPEDHLVDVRLRELLGLDRVFLGRAEEVIEERDVELQELDELADAAVGDVELAVEVEGARVGIRAVERDLAVVDVARELGGVLVLLVLGLEGADADAVLLGEHDAPDLHVPHDLAPVALVELHEVVEHATAERVGLARDTELSAVVLGLERGVELGHDFVAGFARDEHERLFVHGARVFVRFPGALALAAGRRIGLGRSFAVLIEHPTEGVQGAVGGA